MLTTTTTTTTTTKKLDGVYNQRRVLRITR
jgi:hypothetical protein